jgi:hypothetical protein
MAGKITDARIIRSLWLAVPLALSGCHAEGERNGDASRIVACTAPDDARDHPCTLEVEDRAGTLFLTLRHPDGGFRRLVWPKGGTLAAADGAEGLTTVPIQGGGVDVAIGGWHYRIERTGGGLP